MERIILEQSSLVGRWGQEEDAVPLQGPQSNAAQRLTATRVFHLDPAYRRVPHATIQARQDVQQQTDSAPPSPSPLPLHADTYAAAHGEPALPTSLHYGADLYRSYLPASASPTPRRPAPAPPSPPPSPSPKARRPVAAPAELSDFAAADDRTPDRSIASRAPQRRIPSPIAYEVLAAEKPQLLDMQDGGALYAVAPRHRSSVPTHKRYPTPPWWRRHARALMEDDQEDQVSAADARWRDGEYRQQQQDASSLKPAIRQYERGAAADDTSAAHQDGKQAICSSASPPPPPPSRSRTRSAAAATTTTATASACAATASPSSSRPSPSPFDEAAAAEHESPSPTGGMHFVDPNLYRRPTSSPASHLQQQQRREQHKSTGNAQEIAKQHAPLCESGVVVQSDGQQPSRSTASSLREKENTPLERHSVTPRAVVALSTAAAMEVAALKAQRLRVFEESAAHPSGFPVPRRGAGTAAPRHLYNGLAALPASVADRHAIARAAAGGHASVIYGTGNHPSSYALGQYRDGVAAVTGVDPARLRQGSAAEPNRYHRVHSGWVDGVTTSTLHGALLLSHHEEGQPLHTTTRLRLGLAGGGAPRAAELQDPVSGLARKPNEVCAAFLVEAAREHHKQKSSSHVVGMHMDDAQPQRITAGQRGLSDATLQARARAAARSKTLHPTRAPSGLAWTAEEQRLYWAEHAQLHGTAVRGLNAVLQGVGEAEPDLWMQHREGTAPADTLPIDAEQPSSEVAGSEEQAHPWAGESAESFHTHAGSDRSSSHRVARRGKAATGMDTGQAQLQDALRQHRGYESTLMPSSILPAAYRHTTTTSSHLPRAHASTTPREVDWEAAEAWYGQSQMAEEEKEESTLAATADGTMGLVHSHVTQSDLSCSTGGFSRLPRGDANTRAGGPHRMPRGARESAAQPSRASTGRTLPNNTTQPPKQHTTDVPRHDLAHPQLLFPPLLTPLLQEVDECLRFHQFPTVLDMWRWCVADQRRVLRAAGFTAAECDTVVWELERMIRVSSTTCRMTV